MGKLIVYLKARLAEMCDSARNPYMSDDYYSDLESKKEMIEEILDKIHEDENTRT